MDDYDISNGGFGGAFVYACACQRERERDYKAQVACTEHEAQLWQGETNKWIMPETTPFRDNLNDFNMAWLTTSLQFWDTNFIWTVLI